MESICYPMPDPGPCGNFGATAPNTSNHPTTAGNLTRRERPLGRNSRPFNPLVSGPRSSGGTNSANNVWRDGMVHRRSFSLSDLRQQANAGSNETLRPTTSGAPAPSRPQAKIREADSWVSRFSTGTGEHGRVQKVHEELGDGQTADIRYLHTTGGTSSGAGISALSIGDHEEAPAGNLQSTDYPEHIPAQHRRPQLGLGGGGTSRVRSTEEGTDGSWASTSGRLPRGSDTTNCGGSSGSRVHYDQQKVGESCARALAVMRELHLRGGGDGEQEDTPDNRPCAGSTDEQGQLEKPSFLDSVVLAVSSFFSRSPAAKSLAATDSIVDTAIKTIGDNKSNSYDYIELPESLRLTAKDVGMNLVGGLCLVNDDNLSMMAVTDRGGWVEFSADRDYYCILYTEFEVGMQEMQNSPRSSWKSTGGRLIPIS